MDANPAILDRPAPAETAAESSRITPTTQPWRGPWLELGSLQRFEWNRYELPVAALPPALQGLRILHLTDIHMKSAWYPAMDELLRRVQHDPPDLLFITGDFVENKYDARNALPLVERLIGGLRSRFGIYAITGNHDGDFIAARVARQGVNILPIGSPTLVTVRDAQVELIGLAGLTREDARVQHILDIPPRNADAGGPRAPRVVLSHYPDALVRLQRLDVGPDLLFAGHTHGGQVCLPGGVPILRHDTLPRRYCQGVHRVGDSWLIVSRGMGYSSYRIRMFCPAEVVEVILTPSPTGRGPG